jgi:hypothetical protein
MVSTNERGHVEVRCDRCLAAPVTPLGIRTWTSREAALADLLGPELAWELVDGRLRCATCARRVGCERTGHAYGRWAPVPGSQLASRVCRLCAAEDHAPGYVLARASA